jgi:hypothetical protein
MRLATLVREAVDQRIRPGQRGGTTLGGSLPEATLGRCMRCVFLTRPGIGGPMPGGQYGRGRYGMGQYVPSQW